MGIELEALKAPTKNTLDEWLSTPRPASNGELFTPSEPMWNPDKAFANRVNWQTAIMCVPHDWQCWLHAALAYRMAEVRQSSMTTVISVMTRAAKENINPLNEDHLIDLRERFNSTEFSHVAAFMLFWHECESLELRPSRLLADAYKQLPRKKRSKNDPVLSLDPEQGPFTQAEQDALHHWLHEQFCHKNLDPERYLYVRLMMIYGQRGTQIREMVFDDFIECHKGYKINIHWAKQRKEGAENFRSKFETFNLDEDLYKTIKAYQAMILSQLKQDYPCSADWDKAINYVPLFRRKLAGQGATWLNGKTPILLDDLDHKSLEEAPQARFHVPARTTKKWLKTMEGMPGFPISSRTHLPLKITKGHRFRYTLGTDLSNAGLDEWSMARALMHSDTRAVRKYRQVSAELMALVDEKMSDHLALVVNAFAGSIVSDRAFAKNGDRADRQIEDLAVCGADTLCHLDAPFSCYPCSKFQPLVYANHRSALEHMMLRRELTIANDKTTGVLWDRAILACRKVILDCEVLRNSSKLAENKDE